MNERDRTRDGAGARFAEVLAAAVLICAVAGCASAPLESSEAAAAITGEWLGQALPGDQAKLFAPGIVSNGWYTRDLTVTPDGDEIYFTVMLPHFQFSTILVTRRVDGVWTEPEVAPFSGRYKDLEPAVSPDGHSFFFVSHRPEDGAGDPEEDSDIWVMQRTETGWSDPAPLGPPVNTEGQEYFPSVTLDGTLYFTRRPPDDDEGIYRARHADGAYLEPERLGPEVNAGRARFNAWISADESFLILPIAGIEGAQGAVDYYVTFRNDDDTWSGPVNLGDRVNSAFRPEYAASLSPDGRWLFFMGTRGRYADSRMEPPLDRAALERIHSEPENGNPDIYWIDAGFIQDLRP